MKKITISILAMVLFTITAQAAPLEVAMSGRTITGTSPMVTFNLADPGTEAAITNVFNLQGQRVAELTAQSLSHFSWDGNDVDNQPVEPGMYVVQIHHNGAVWHGPVMVNR